MRTTTLTLATLLLALLGAQTAFAQSESPEKDEPRDVEKYLLGRKNLAIKGYDPVAYFPEGGSEPTKGSKKIEHVHDQVRYRFATEENRDLFIENPERYEPAYGGWCAYAIAREDYTKPNPKRFVIQDERLLLFYDGIGGDTHKRWHKEGPEELLVRADTFWEEETGEAPPAASRGRRRERRRRTLALPFPIDREFHALLAPRLRPELPNRDDDDREHDTRRDPELPIIDRESHETPAARSDRYVAADRTYARPNIQPSWRNAHLAPPASRAVTTNVGRHCIAST